MTSRIRHFPAFCQNESENSQMWYRLLLRKRWAHLSSKMKIRYIVHHYKMKNILEYKFARRMRCMFSEGKTTWIWGYFHWKWQFCNFLPTSSSRHMTNHFTDQTEQIFGLLLYFLFDGKGLSFKWNHQYFWPIDFRNCTQSSRKN